jgi:putative phosphoesterase
MRVAALYDIHGNLPALEAVLDEIRLERVDLVVIGGDVVPGPMPRETLTHLLNLARPMRFIRGNGDREVLASMRGVESATVPEQFRDAIRWNAGQLRPEDERTLASWPLTLQIRIPELGEVLFCHATPRSDAEIFTSRTPDDRVLPLLAEVDAPLVVCGHTHMQFDRIVGSTRVVNAGSVGMPFGEPAAYWLMVGPAVELRRTSYDLGKAAERIRSTSYPQAEDFAARNVLHPPSEAQMLELFTRAG